MLFKKLTISSVLATLKNGFKVPGSNLIKLHHAAVKTFLPGDFLEVTTFYEGVKSKVVFLSGGLINVTLLRGLNVAETSKFLDLEVDLNSSSLRGTYKVLLVRKMTRRTRTKTRSN